MNAYQMTTYELTESQDYKVARDAPASSGYLPH